MSEIHALIVAAGTGERFAIGAEKALPKQYIRLNRQSLLRRSIEAFLAHPAINRVQVVIHPDHKALYEEATAGLRLPPPIPGGANRQESVRLGLEALKGPKAPAHILVHDAARPLVSAELITRVCEGVKKHPGVIPALPVRDTLKRAETDQGNLPIIRDTVDRNGLWAVQTPQGFHFRTLLDAHQRLSDDAGEGITDDAGLFEVLSLEVRVVDGDAANLKITTPEDLVMAETLLHARMETRTGMGTDVHRLIQDKVRPLMLCGVEIPSEWALEGHSDADAGLHALTDAIFGALGEGDIGQHFPPSDVQWKNADSVVFLKEALRKLEARGGVLVHADLTLLAEKPKLSPHYDAMRVKLAALCGVHASAIGLKATTTEGLGFIGRGEGILAQAVVTVKVLS